MTPFIKSLFWISAVTLVSLPVCFYLYENYKKVWKLNLATLISVFWGLVLAVLIIDTIAFQQAALQVPAILAGLGGASVGWLVGMWLSPMGNTESTKFSRYWTVIGVGSGFSMKWVLDKVMEHHQQIYDHWFVASIGTIACLVCAATVYNSRAYNATLVVYPRRNAGAPATNTNTDGPFTLGVGETQVFYAEVIGPSDPLSRWQVIPPTLGTIDESGQFTAGSSKGSGKIVAFNIEDPTLSNCLEIQVTES